LDLDHLSPWNAKCAHTKFKHHQYGIARRVRRGFQMCPDIMEALSMGTTMPENDSWVCRDKNKEGNGRVCS
jgi:hypothetical protein